MTTVPPAFACSRRASGDNAATCQVQGPWWAHQAAAAPDQSAAALPTQAAGADRPKDRTDDASPSPPSPARCRSCAAASSYPQVEAHSISSSCTVSATSRALGFCGSSAAEAAPRTMRPRCSLAVLASTESIVDLPQPFPPTTACTAPAENVTSSPRSTQPPARS